MILSGVKLLLTSASRPVQFSCSHNVAWCVVANKVPRTIQLVVNHRPRQVPEPCSHGAELPVVRILADWPVRMAAELEDLSFYELEHPDDPIFDNDEEGDQEQEGNQEDSHAPAAGAEHDDNNDDDDDGKLAQAFEPVLVRGSGRRPVVLPPRPLPPLPSSRPLPPLPTSSSPNRHQHHRRFSQHLVVPMRSFSTRAGSKVPKPGPAKLTTNSGLPEWLSQAKLCRYLPEAIMKQLCERVKECLMEGEFIARAFLLPRIY